MKNLLSVLSLAVIIISVTACKHDKPDVSREQSVGQLRSSTPIENSKLVNNPVTADQPMDLTKLPKMEFEEKSFDFGKIKEGDQVFHEFKFKNTGNAPLIISEAHGSCGCTVPEWPKEPLAPGAENIIKVKFNSTNKEGQQHKTVTMTANTYPNTQNEITITAIVESAKK